MSIIEANKRKTNIELLRIIAVLMIISSHLVIHGIIDVPEINSYITWTKGSLINRVIASLLISGGDIGVGAFFIISGYFLCNIYIPRNNIIKIIITVYFYAWLSLLLWIILRSKIQFDELSLKDLTAFFLPVSSNVWWFASAYIILLLVAPTINYWISKLNNQCLLKVIIFLWLLWYCVGKVINVQYYFILRAIWYYLIGNYINKKGKYTKKHLSFVVFLANWMFYAVATYIIGLVIGNRIETLETLSNIMRFSRYTLFAPAGAVALFVLFLNLEICQNKTINNIAGKCFGIYLLHDSPLIRNLIWSNILHVERKFLNNTFLLWAFFDILFVFLLGYLIDSVRNKILIIIKHIADTK